MPFPIYLLLGSNLGDRSANLNHARQEISRSVGEIITTSSIYRSAAWGNTKQEDFYNQVLEIRSTYKPEELLQRILEIELQMGRIREEKWGPRIIDIDMLFYGQLIHDSKTLTIPHKEIPHRKFTLLPLGEIASDFIHPTSNKTILQLLIECKDDLAVEKLDY